MADDFNPYHIWFGIPPEDQPANHYRLLGLRPFESNGDAIDSAADRQMAHLRTFQSGKHGELTQRLLNEVAAARISLLDPQKRTAYDQQLRAKLAATTAPAPATGASPQSAGGANPQTAGGSAIRRQSTRRPADAAPAASIPTAAALPQPANQWDDLLGKPGAKSAVGTVGKSSAPKRSATNRNLSIGIAVAVALVAVVGIGIVVLGGSSTDGTLAFDWPANDRADTTLLVDGVALAIPASGPWEYQYPAGAHRIVAAHLAYKLDAHVEVVAGERKTVPADWKPKATLVLNWPLALRSGAELRIDGRTQAVSQHEPFEVAVEPGRRTILITRRGFDPIRTMATVAADGRELVSIAAPPTMAKLVFDWPAGDRKNAELTVDGRSQTVAADSDSAPFELTLPLGQHVVHIARAGFEPFNQSIELSAGTDRTLKPTWTVEQKAAPTVAETSVPADAAATQPANKLPVPETAEQETIAKQLNDLYKTSLPGSKDPAKAQELYDVAAKAGGSPAERYMLLLKGAEIAAAAGDLNLSLQGIDTLDADYDIDALDLKQKLLEKFIAAGKPEQVAEAILIAEQLVDQALAADRFDIALVLATSASKAVAKSKTATHKEDEERLTRRRHDIHMLEPIYLAAKKAQETLGKNPADPEASLIVGRWVCFYKANWSAGLPMFVKGSDEKLKALAEQEIKAPTDADQQVQIADTWWDLAQKEAGVARNSIRAHAGSIYQGASGNLASALKKAAIEKRLAEIAELKPIGTTPNAGKPIVATKFLLNHWVDVLPLVDAKQNTIDGTWSRHGTQLSNASGKSRLEIPVKIQGSYDLEVVFTRIAGREEVVTMFPVASRPCMVTLSTYHGEVSGLMDLDGHHADSCPISVRPGSLENGHRYRVLINVRVASEDRCSIDLSLDGKPYLPHWEGNSNRLSRDPVWALPGELELGLGGAEETTYDSVRLRMLSGRAAAIALVRP